MSADKFTERVLRFIQAKDYEPRKARDIAIAMGIGEEEFGDFHDACKALMRSGRIVLGSRQALMPAPPPGTITGTFRANARGFGFVVPDAVSTHGDLYIPAGASGTAITGDHVVAEIRKRNKRQGKLLLEGRIVRVLKRGTSRFVGELCRQFSRWLVVPDGNLLHAPIAVGDPGAKGAKPGDQVVVELVRYPAPMAEAQGVIVKVLGVRGEPNVDTQSIIEQHGLPGEFPEPALAETREVAAAFDVNRAIENRLDLTKQLTITIDPVDARDFDDAISLMKLDNGNFELGVHIADVSYFVREGGPLDNEARARSNSVYLPRTVIPMLPEVLSNGLCSLQERQPRLTKSAFITYDDDGEVISTRFANSVIKSTKRLTYEQASAILDGKPGRTSAKVVALLGDMNLLARAIRARRIREGMLVLETPDIELVHDDDGRVIDVVPADNSFSHTIIEMFMVEANEAVSTLLTSLGAPHLRRVHGHPGSLNDGSLQRFLGALGYLIPDGADRFDLQRLLDEVRGKPEAFAVNLAVLRSMQQAVYSPETEGHYALASKNYAHFTSPIRRYPDLTVHRLFDRYVEGSLNDKDAKRSIPTVDDLHELGELCSANERRAEAAERELQLVLILRLLESRVGDEVEGTVTGVANFGVFVQLDRYLIDGLLRFESLPDDWWEVDSNRGCVMGERSGRRITVGDRLRVSLARISIPTRQLDLALAQSLVRASNEDREKALLRRKERAKSNPGRTGRETGKGRKTKSRSGKVDPRRKGRKR